MYKDNRLIPYACNRQKQNQYLDISYSGISELNNYFHNALCTHQNECTLRTDNTTVHTFSEDSNSSLSTRIKHIDTCTCMCARFDKTIYSSIKTQ